MIRYKGVGFSSAAVAKAKKADFVSLHEKVLWLDCKLTERRKRLAEVYDIATKTK